MGTPMPNVGYDEEHAWGSPVVPTETPTRAQWGIIRMGPAGGEAQHWN